MWLDFAMEWTKGVAQAVTQARAEFDAWWESASEAERHEWVQHQRALEIARASRPTLRSFLGL